MEEVLSPGGRTLKHEAVREYVRRLIADELPGAPAPSERELVSRFGVARMTVRQALDALVGEGLLERRPGRGTFVARPPRTSTPVLSFTDEMSRRGLVAESQTLVLRLEQAGPGVADALGITAGDAVIHWRRLRHADGAPMSIEDAFLNEVLLPGFLQGVALTSLYAELDARGLRPSWVQDTITAGVVAREESALLGLPTGSAVVRKQRRGLCGSKVVEVSRSILRADRYTMSITLGGND